MQPDKKRLKDVSWLIAFEKNININDAALCGGNE